MTRVGIERFAGVFPVLATPFAPDGAVDTESLRRHVRLCIDAGVDGLTALGVTSETMRLTAAERELILQVIAFEVDEKLPIIVGATAQGIEPCLEYCKQARALGAAAVMVGPPRMASFDPVAVRHYFMRLASASDLPIVVPDYPQACGYSMDSAFLATLLREVKGICAIKLEDAPSAPKIARLLAESGDAAAPIFGGLGGVYLLEELLAGAAGAMTGFAFPEALVEILADFRAGHIDLAAERFYYYVPLMRFEFQEGIGTAIRKEILRRRDVLQHATVRSPAPSLDPSTSAALDRILSFYRRKSAPAWICA